MAPGQRAPVRRAAAALPRRGWSRRAGCVLAAAASGCLLRSPEALPFSHVWRTGSDGALGVFATERIGRGQVVERCYCLPVRANNMVGQWLRPWLFDRGRGPGEPMLFPLGFGCLYNEVPTEGDVANLRWEYQEIPDAHGVPRPYLVLIAFAIIAAGQELCVKRQRTGDHNSLRDIISSSLRFMDADAGSTVPSKLYDEFFVPSTGGGPYSMDPPSGVKISSSPLHGNGVFATRSFKKGETVEVVPSLMISTSRQVGQTFRDYEFAGPHPTVSRVALGHGSVYNHREEPNVLKCAVGAASDTLGPVPAVCQRYYAARDIDAGEELCIFYGKGWFQRCVG
ncbi:unnamed protein product [Prorocentrum cordatum]|uniref:SET domain-containing protein n=1 Tax=Prorocentrum cordatum TaxID=2364126 RepID=A0ABN9VG71_9DINO|nr:unnamed protein product [Polarella glacialis]